MKDHHGWLSKNVLLISMSAFFSDLGYQSVLAALPIFLVLILHAPVYVFGIVIAISSGLGSLIGYLGGKMSDKYGMKKVSILGNAFIPLLSLTGIAANLYEAATLFSSGWLARNFRSPARRALISNEATPNTRGRIFGFLNALDVGGGVLSVAILILLTYLKFPLRYILLYTAIPITFATILLLFVKEKKKPQLRQTKKETPFNHGKAGRSAYLGVLAATALYGFSFYSLGFPILTIAQSTGNNVEGFASYAVFLLASALFGYYIGTRKFNIIRSLGFMGYIMSAVGALFLGISYLYDFGPIALYLSVIIIGMAVGTIDTLEPNLITQIKTKAKRGEGMGMLTSSRSIGIFTGNLVMGILYYYGPFYSYMYAAAIAVLGGCLLLIAGSKFSGRI